uniref:Zinc finger and BTB domain containing 5 n=1 Tax=Mola mola TaxID=94237 RepID=A0A3Q4AI23_MOLML
GESEGGTVFISHIYPCPLGPAVMLLFKQLNHQRLHAQLCDCVVLVGGQSFQAHRSILAACSSHFRALLSSADSADEAGADTGGRGSPSVIELDPEVVTPEAFSTLLDMIYTSALSLRASNVMDVLLAASHLHLNAVVKQQQQQQQRHSQVEGSVMSVMSVREEDMDEERVGAEVSQSGSIEEQRHLSASHKRKSHEDRLSGIKKSYRPPEGNYKECSPTVTRSSEEETEEKYEKLECQNSEAQPSDSPSSLVFPVSSVPLQQLLPTQGSGFSDTLILQPTQNPLTGFLSSIRPGLGLETSLVQTSRAGKSSGATTFRRIAPKVPPGSEAGADLSSPSVGNAADRPSLTRASEEVLSKCKKAAAEDHVLLVEGEKKYACKICCKTFMNLTDCKKHIRVHTGEKPYPCPKCGKRFSQSSHLDVFYGHSTQTCASTVLCVRLCHRGGPLHAPSATGSTSGLTAPARRGNSFDPARAERTAGISVLAF